MTDPILPLRAAMLACLTCAATTATAAELRLAEDPVRGQYIVVIKPGAARLAGEAGPGMQIADAVDRLLGKHGGQLLYGYDHVLRGYSLKADDETLAALLADPIVDYVEEDGRVTASATQTSAPWGLDRSDQRDLPRNGTYDYATTASSVHAYIIDSGILPTHSQFTNRMANGYTAVADGRGTNDCNGHGTHVAGTLGGTTYGIAKGVKLHPVRVLDCAGSGTASSVIAGVNWVAANHVKPAIANLSVGGGANESLDTAINDLNSAGVASVVAAGNNNIDACLTSPARVPVAITVGSVRNDDGRSSFSNVGTCLDLFAPGSAIVSAGTTSPTSTRTLSGTSMAAPHVAGAAALYLAGSPLATPSQVANHLRTTASPGRVLAAGVGSPNRLLYTRGGTTGAPPGNGALPTITGLICPDRSMSGGGRFYCHVTYTSSSPAAVLWPSDAQGTTLTGRCSAGTVSPITVVVGNRYGSVQRTSASFPCPTNVIP